MTVPSVPVPPVSAPSDDDTPRVAATSGSPTSGSPTSGSPASTTAPAETGALPPSDLAAPEGDEGAPAEAAAWPRIVPLSTPRAIDPLRILILSRNANLYSTRRLREAAEQRGHRAEVIDPLHCYMDITSARPEVHYRGEKLEGVDAVIPRIGQSITFYGTAVVRQFEMMGVFTLNDSIAISRSRDKLRCLQLLAKKGVGLPVTGFASSPDNTGDLIRLVGGAPLIVKLVEGTHGKGVVLAETRKAAASVIEAFRGLKANFLVQEFIQEANGADIRAFVVGDKVVAAMRRQGAEGEFRSNLHRGGSASPIRITPQERATAVRAARITGLNVAGVDMLRSERGPLVMEVNVSPGLEGIERATEKDIAGRIIEYLERHPKRAQTHRRSNG